MWEGRTFENDRAVGVTFTLHSPDGDEGYPGNVTVQVRCVVWGWVGLGGTMMLLCKCVISHCGFLGAEELG